MKKALVLAIFATLSLTACGGQKESTRGLPMTRKEGARRLRQTGETDGFKIEFSYQNGEEAAQVEASMKGNISWYTKGAEGIALEKAEKYYHVFLSDGKGYDYAVSYKQDVFESFFASGSALYLAHQLDDVKFTKGEAATILERECTYYTFSYDAGAGAMDYKVAIDNEFGITLKIECDNQGALLKFDATKFQIGGDIEVPELPEVEDIVDANDQADTKIQVPNKVHIELKCGTETPWTYTIEVVDDEIYVLDASINTQYYATKEGKKFVVKEKNLSAEDPQWADTTITADDVYGVLSWLSCGNIFDMGELYNASKKGQTTYNGYPCTWYKSRSYNLYLSSQYKMFIFMESIGEGSNPEWNREVTEFHSIDAVSVKAN